MIIDNSPPVPTCSFDVGATLTETGPGVYFDSQLEYSVTENCAGLGPISVTVDTFSNEFELDKSMPQVSHFKYGGSTKYNAWVATAICNNGASGQCIVDPEAPDRRFYTTRITATDQAGLTASTTCQVAIEPVGGGGGNGGNNGINGNGPNQTPSQEFLVASNTDGVYVPDGV